MVDLFFFKTKHTHTNTRIWQMLLLYSASQKKWNQELSMFYHNLITIIINKWHIFVKLRSSPFIWCNSHDAYFTHEWLKSIWRKRTKSHLADNIWISRENHISRKFIFFPFIWHLNQEKWTRNNKVLFA